MPYPEILMFHFTGTSLEFVRIAVNPNPRAFFELLRLA
jgi:hypothetical protein